MAGKQTDTSRPDMRPGDLVRVHENIIEKIEKRRADKKMEKQARARLQIFEGTVIARKHGNEPGATFTVRKVASGVGVEKIFPLHSPNIAKIEIVSRGRARRAKLYYIRRKAAKEISRKMGQERIAPEAETSSGAPAETAELAAAQAPS